VGEWIFPPSFSNTQGTISLVGGFLFEGINTSEGLITTIVFEAVSEGVTDIYFLETSKILVGGEGGVDILSSLNRGAYYILPPPFLGPKIFSETHPDQNRWYKNNSPSFSWEKIEGVEASSFSLDDDPFGEPDNVVDTVKSFVSFEEVEDGIQYFHLKSKKDEVWGGTSHFKVMIDRTSPMSFEPTLEPFSFTAGKDLLIYFNTTDSLSGMDNYKARITNLTNPENIVFSGWIRAESPFRLKKEARGVFEVTIRAFDKAGNFQEGRFEARVLNPIFVFTSTGIQILGLFLSWRQFYLLAFVIFSAIGFLILRLVKSRQKEELSIELEKEIKEAIKEIEDVKKAEERLRRLRKKEERAGEEWRRLRRDLQQQIEKKG
jgi:hypothetical protein